MWDDEKSDKGIFIAFNICNMHNSAIFEQNVTLFDDGYLCRVSTESARFLG